MHQVVSGSKKETLPKLGSRLCSCIFSRDFPYEKICDNGNGIPN